MQLLAIYNSFINTLMNFTLLSWCVYPALYATICKALWNGLSRILNPQTKYLMLMLADRAYFAGKASEFWNKEDMNHFFGNCANRMDTAPNCKCNFVWEKEPCSDNTIRASVSHGECIWEVVQTIGGIHLSTSVT